MATFARLWAGRHSLLADVNAELRTAEINKDRELRAAITIQAIRRGLVARRVIKKKLVSCKTLQRIWRGFLARQYTCHISMLRDKRRALELWTRAAVILQKTFRAFYSRRYKHSYYERQAYLASVSLKEEKVRELSDALAESTYMEREQLRHDTEQQDFTTLAKDLHHLVSTSNIPGVFNSPYNMEPVRAFGAPVETHLKTTFAKSQYLQRHMMRSLGAQRYQALRGHMTGTGKSFGGSTSYTHSSYPRPLEPVQEEGRRGKGSSRAA